MAKNWNVGSSFHFSACFGHFLLIPGRGPFSIFGFRPVFNAMPGRLTRNHKPYRAGFREGDEDSNSSFLRVRPFNEWPGPLHWSVSPVEILTKPLIHWMPHRFHRKPFFSLKCALSHPLPKIGATIVPSKLFVFRLVKASISLQKEKALARNTLRLSGNIPDKETEFNEARVWSCQRLSFQTQSHCNMLQNLRNIAQKSPIYRRLPLGLDAKGHGKERKTAKTSEKRGGEFQPEAPPCEICKQVWPLTTEIFTSAAAVNLCIIVANQGQKGWILNRIQDETFPLSSCPAWQI